MLADKIKSATNYKIEESFFPKETLYPNADKNQYTLNLGKNVKLNQQQINSMRTISLNIFVKC
jgi:hypothetical protein